jgi:hypothetical protein
MKNSTRFLKTVIASMVVITVLAGAVFAAPWEFGDVKGHWAEAYIQKMALKGIIQGVGGGLFAPNKEVTRLQSVVMLTRIKHHDSTIPDRPIPPVFKGTVASWGKRYVAMAVEEGIIAGDDLENFRPDEPTKRYEAAVFAVRTLGLAEKAEALKTINLNFSDTYKIPMQARGYVQIAVEEGIITGYGDGSFRPLETLSRAEAATLFYRVDRKLKNEVDDKEVSGTVTSVDAFILPSVTIELEDGTEETIYVNNSTSIFAEGKKASLKDVAAGNYVTAIYNESKTYALFLEAFEEPPLQPEERTISYGGTIDNLHEDLRMIVINRNDGQKVSHTIKQGADILLNDEPVTVSELVPGQSITYYVDKETNDIVRISAVGIDEVVEGKVVFVSYGGAIDKMIQIKTFDGDEKKLYRIAEDVVVTKNGEPATLESIMNYDMVKLSVAKSKVVKIEAESAEKEVSGKLVSISYKEEQPHITIELSSGEEVTYPVDIEEVDVERNNDDAELTDLLKGDEVELTLTYNVVTEIEADSVKQEIEGTIVSFSVGEEITITVLDEEDDTQKTFILAPDARIKKNGQTISPSEFSAGIRGCRVEMNVESEVIVKMYIEDAKKATYFSGIIKAIHEKNNIIVVEKTNGNTKTIIVDDDTSFMRGNSKTRFSRLDVGNNVTVFGQYDGAIFKASLVVVTDLD